VHDLERRLKRVDARLNSTVWTLARRSGKRGLLRRQETEKDGGACAAQQ